MWGLRQDYLRSQEPQQTPLVFHAAGRAKVFLVHILAVYFWEENLVGWKWNQSLLGDGEWKPLSQFSLMYVRVHFFSVERWSFLGLGLFGLWLSLQLELMSCVMTVDISLNCLKGSQGDPNRCWVNMIQDLDNISQWWHTWFPVTKGCISALRTPMKMGCVLSPLNLVASGWARRMLVKRNPCQTKLKDAFGHMEMEPIWEWWEDTAIREFPARWESRGSQLGQRQRTHCGSLCC